MIRKTLLALAAAALVAGPASAAKITFNGITVEDNGRATIAQRPTTMVAPPHLDAKLKAIYSNIGFKYPNSLYFCCLGWAVSGPTSILNAQNWIASPFTPTADRVLKRADLALQLGAGTNEAVIGIYDDNGNVPGTLLGKVTVTDLTGVASCCGLVVAMFREGIPVKAGQQYWLAAMTSKKATDTYATWLENTSDEISAAQLAGNSGSGWQQGVLLIPHLAYAVYGE
jgi:hypothetical protein